MKKIISAVMAALCLVSCTFALTNDEAAELLNDAGLLEGVDTELGSGREITRLEGAGLLIIGTGAKERAENTRKKCNFTDIQESDRPYMAYLCDKGYIKGKSDTYFGADETLSVREFTVMLLRILGYSEKNGDFTYETAEEFAKNLGIYSKAKTLRIADALNMLCLALNTHVKGESVPLAVYNTREKDCFYSYSGAKIVTGRHKVYTQLKKTLAAMDAAGSYTLTQNGEYMRMIRGSTDSDAKLTEKTSGVLHTDMENGRASLSVTNTGIIGGTKESETVEFETGGNRVLVRKDGSLWEENTNIGKDTLIFAHRRLFPMNYYTLEYLDMYEEDGLIHLRGVYNRYDALSDLSIPGVTDYLYDIDIEISPETDLINRVVMSYDDEWINVYDMPLDVEFSCELVFSDYGETSAELEMQ